MWLGINCGLCIFELLIDCLVVCEYELELIIGEDVLVEILLFIYIIDGLFEWLCVVLLL